MLIVTDEEAPAVTSPAKNLTFSFRTNNGTKLKIELKIKTYQTISYTSNSDSASHQNSLLMVTRA